MSRIRMPGRPSMRHAVKVRLRRARLHTVCEEAKCPNIAECFGSDTATFLVLGDVCTRNCRFCAIAKGRRPQAPPDPGEPGRLAAAVRELGISHAVITSVTRDDLPDGGAEHFAACVHQIRNICPQTSVEVLVPDFGGSKESLDTVLDAAPDVLNHNIETVARLYPLVRPGADFARSLGLLEQAARKPGVIAKSGLMVGLGEEIGEVVDAMRALMRRGCKIVTIGQYLQPARDNLKVVRMVEEEEFGDLAEEGRQMGLEVVAGPLVRSSYKAREIYHGVCAATASGGRSRQRVDKGF